MPPSIIRIQYDSPFSCNIDPFRLIPRLCDRLSAVDDGSDFGHQVVVKFIRKDKVLKDGWLDDPQFGRVPLEISILAKLEHPNIVQVRCTS